jgi:hypothetical protein
MTVHNYAEDVERLTSVNPALDSETIGVILTAQSLYSNGPDDLREFRERYGHFNPEVIDNPHGILFLKMVQSADPPAKIRERLNRYLNIKFRDIAHPTSYAENMKVFSEHCANASSVLSDILRIADLPHELVAVLREQQQVQRCGDFYELLRLYRRADDRTRFEILRKIGLIVLMARINRTVAVKELDSRIHDVQQGLTRGIGYRVGAKKVFYFWISHENRVQINGDRVKAARMHREDSKLREERMLPAYPLQSYECHPFQTPQGNHLIMLSVRSKFHNDGMISYTSFVEKMIRKNLEYPNQVRDILGVRIIVVTEDEVEKTIRELETFLGGTSTRKQEKDTYHKFGKRVLNRFSADEYFVWKAIYDLPLPHPSIKNVQHMLSITHEPEVGKELQRTLQIYLSHPRDFVIEVQLQDLKSYLQSIVQGSPTEHALLKKHQVRASSFYKFFPKEIYEREVGLLVKRLMNASR